MAALFGGLVGAERGRRRQAAGLRTHMLVCMGAALVMITNQYICAVYGTGDPSRLGAQVISGIGFLGVGTIIVDRQQQVRGLTTAAGLWSCACVGLAVGIGFYLGAVIAIVMVLATIVTINKLEYRINKRSKLMKVYSEFTDHKYINEFVATMRQRNIKVTQMEVVLPRNAEEQSGIAAVIFMLQLPKRMSHENLIGKLEHSPGVQSLKAM